jgi:pimeloyl-ACP methyl ester carboxylesterase
VRQNGYPDVCIDAVPAGAAHLQKREISPMTRLSMTVRMIALGLLLACLAVGLWLWTPDKSRAELETKYLTSRADYLDVAGLRLHMRDSGPRDAPAVILLHGFGASLHTWEPWAAALSSQFRVIRFDIPGFGLTGADPTGDYSDARSVAVIAALMDKLALPRASLVGHSMGGRLAWTFAAAAPERVEKLALVAPDGFASPGFGYGKVTPVPAFMKAMKYVLPKAMLRMNLAPAYADPNRLTDAVTTRYHELMLAPGVRGAILDRMQQMVLQPPEPLLRKITAPTLLLWGDKDAMIPAANALDYVGVMPKALRVVLPNLGHVPHEEAPTQSLPPVLAFLRDGSAAR